MSPIIRGDSRGPSMDTLSLSQQKKTIEVIKAVQSKLAARVTDLSRRTDELESALKEALRHCDRLEKQLAEDRHTDDMLREKIHLVNDKVIQANENLLGVLDTVMAMRKSTLAHQVRRLLFWWVPSSSASQAPPP